MLKHHCKNAVEASGPSANMAALHAKCERLSAASSVMISMTPQLFLVLVGDYFSLPAARAQSLCCQLLHARIQSILEGFECRVIQKLPLLKVLMKVGLKGHDDFVKGVWGIGMATFLLHFQNKTLQCIAQLIFWHGQEWLWNVRH